MTKSIYCLSTGKKEKRLKEFSWEQDWNQKFSYFLVALTWNDPSGGQLPKEFFQHHIFSSKKKYCRRQRKKRLTKKLLIQITASLLLVASVCACVVPSCDVASTSNWMALNSNNQVSNQTMHEILKFKNRFGRLWLS